MSLLRSLVFILALSGCVSDFWFTKLYFGVHTQITGGRSVPRVFIGEINQTQNLRRL
jgi:hypothetical protein